MIDRKEQETRLYEMLSNEAKQKTNLEDISTEAYLLAKDEIDFLKLDLRGPLPDWVMVYFYGFGKYTGFIMLDAKQEHVLLLGVLNEKDEILRTEIFENQDKGAEK
ncbi:hypothetical protein JCM15457_1435 [Liquorilactobacillus sucicola DSM 21376 = JCM 15457]|nr:hypothetical protein [Liquorilactobacillus sucicola]GAJ26505.1 hypothetical protein JCM15457_1435 [Liquorilactobacillus sucicola DSM 21376 = JCM 15457]